MKKFDDGDIISAIVLVKSIKKNKTKLGADYLKLEINDGTEDITAYVWDISIYDFKEGEMIKVKGDYETFNNRPKINVRSAYKTTEVIKLPSLKTDEFDDLVKRFDKLYKLVTDEHFKLMLDSIFDAILQKFLKAPAAKSNHQAYLGGLLEHTVKVTELCYDIYQKNSHNINLDLLITGAILHDIGKIKEYEYTINIDRSTTGKLIGHTSLGLMILCRLMPNDIPSKKSTELIHLILSHHGKRDWGAPVEPLMKEAVILHHCDMIDCYAARFDEVKDKNDVAEWSEFDNTYNRSWYLMSLRSNS